MKPRERIWQIWLVEHGGRQINKGWVRYVSIVTDASDVVQYIVREWYGPSTWISYKYVYVRHAPSGLTSNLFTPYELGWRPSQVELATPRYPGSRGRRG